MSRDGAVSTITVIGEVLVDLAVGQDWSCRATPGGAPANVAVGLARLGQHVSLRARLSGDGLGLMLREHLVASGVDVVDIVAAGEPTTLAVAALDPGGQARYDFRLWQTADWMWREAELPPLPPQVAALYMGSLACALPPGAALIEGLARRTRAAGHAVIAYDPNLRPGAVPGAGDSADERARVERQLQLAHLVKASADDIGLLYPGQPPAAVARHWIGLGADLVVLTLGAAGALAVSRSGAEVSVPARIVTVQDTIGAGDAFSAGLLAAMAESGLLGGPGLARVREISPAVLSELLTRASLVAALTCERAGADPPTREEVELRLDTAVAVDGSHARWASEGDGTLDEVR